MEEDKKVVCPCCGQKTLRVPVDIPDSLKDIYIACMISGEPYKQCYKLFQGKLIISVQDLPRVDVDTMTQLNIKALTLPEERKDQLQKIIGRAYRLLPILNISIISEDAEKVYKVRENTLSILREVNNGLSVDQLCALYTAFSNVDLFSAVPEQILDSVVSKHILQSRAIMQSGFDQSFYQGISHAS